MVDLYLVKQANKQLLRRQRLIAVFVGATQGVGSYALLELARTHGTDGKGLSAYLVGRNPEAAARIIAECKRLCPIGQFTFVKSGDLSLLQEVDETCKDLVEALGDDHRGTSSSMPAIDILCMTQGNVRFGPAKFTSEGLELSHTLIYYSRMRIIINLLPLLTASALPAHIISICSAGLEWVGPFYPNDLAFTYNPKAHYGYMAARSQGTRMTTFFFECLAQQNLERLSLVHMHPGLVLGDTIWSSERPWWFFLIFRLLYPLLWLFVTTSPEESGQRTLYLATERFTARSQPERMTNTSGDVAMGTDGLPGGGAYSVSAQNEDNHIEQWNSYRKLREESMRQKVWEHTIRVFESIVGAEKFEDGCT